MTDSLTLASPPGQDAQAKDREISTERAVCTLTDGLKCNVRTGGVDLYADMPEAYGGNGSAPNPGVYVRAGMASCLAILVKMTAAQMTSI